MTMPKAAKPVSLQKYADQICDLVMHGELMNAAHVLRALPKDSAIATTAYVVDKVRNTSYYQGFLTVLSTFAGG